MLLGCKQVLDFTRQVYVALGSLLVEVGVTRDTSSDIVLEDKEISI